MSSLTDPHSDWGAQPASDPSRPTVCITYSHKDEAWKERLATQLKVLENLGLLEPWSDQGDWPIEEMRRQMKDAMDRAAIAVLLISADYLASPFVRDEEIPRLMQKRAEEGLRVIPLIVRPCPWHLVPWLKQIIQSPEEVMPLSTLSEAQAETDLAALAAEIANIVAPDNP